MEHYAMIVLGGRWRGLVCSVSRLVHFGAPPAEVRRKMASLAQVDAAYISSTRQGNLLGNILQAGLDTYSRQGYPNEWEMHHQGGLAGYEPREVKVTPGLTRPVRAGQVFAWNPTIAGTKMEDSILVGAEGFENLTRTPKLPVIPVVMNGLMVETPDILVVT
jgi:antitoxin VapB